MDVSQMADCLSDPKLPPSGDDDQICVDDLDSRAKTTQSKSPFPSAPFELDPIPPTVDDLVQRLAELEERPHTPPKDGISTRSRLGKSTSKISNSTRSLIDSGYASIASKHEDVETDIPQQPGTSGLRAFDRPIPDYLQHQFYDLKVLYSKDLIKAVYKKNVAQKDLSMKLKYLGASELTAQLYIVVQCEPRSAKKVKRFFARGDVQEFLGNVFKLHVIDKSPRGLASMDQIEVYGRDSWSASTMCGQPIMLSNGETCAFSTIGGIVQVRKHSNEPTQLYGFTAAHSLVPLLGWHDAKSSIPKDHSSDTSDDGNEEDDVDGVNEALFENLTESVSEPEAQPFHIQEASILGSVVANSVNMAANRDWSLVTLSSRCWLPNLLKLQDSLMEPKEKILYFSAAELPFPYCASVTVTTCRGPQQGRLETNNSVLFSSPGADFIWTYDLKLEAGCALRPGDSGSWVVDTSSGRVLGHVASIDAFGEAFVVPLADTLVDIRENLAAADVSLPGKDDIAKLQSMTATLTPAAQEAKSSPTESAGTSKLDFGQQEGLGHSVTRQPSVNIRAGTDYVSDPKVKDLSTDIALRAGVAGTEPSSLQSSKSHYGLVRKNRSLQMSNNSQRQQSQHDRTDLSQQLQADATQRRTRDTSRITVQDASFTPPARAHSGPTFTLVTGSDGVQHLALSTLEGSSPRTFFTGSTLGGTTLPSDDEISFIPLLDEHESPAKLVQDFNELVTHTTTPLIPMSFSDDMLLQHLRDAQFGDALGTYLNDTLSQRQSELDTALSFRDFAAYEREEYVSAAFEVYNVGMDAKVNSATGDEEAANLPKIYPGDGPFGHANEIVDAPLMWESIKDVNIDGSAAGRITIIQEPTLLMLAALHLTMSPHFDMSEIFEHFLSDDLHHRTHACLNRAFERLPSTVPSTAAPAPAFNSDKVPFSSFSNGVNIRQRTFFFVFRYYTVVGDGLCPAPWQRFDKRSSNKRLGDHVDIAECGSVLALSLGGEPKKPLRTRRRRERARDGFLFDTFSNWHVLNIQSFPDDQHTVRTQDFRQRDFYNGPYAFLDLLTAEYRDAGRRTQLVHEHITKLITPPTVFIFDSHLRDRLLFEDEHFSYIRRYFWAYNTLAVINTSIKAMIASYTDNFTDDFWDGTHPLLWPHPSPHSREGKAYGEKMRAIRKTLEKRVAELGEVLARNERTRKEIENLRDQLFSGTSIRESRKAIDQGDNIRILTYASIIFLPATFVTSVWGMSEFSVSPEDWSFALTMILACAPFITFVFLLQTRFFTRLWRKSWTLVSENFWKQKRRVRRDAEIQNVTVGDWTAPNERGKRLMVVDWARRAARRLTMGGRKKGQRGLDRDDWKAI